MKILLQVLLTAAMYLCSDAEKWQGVRGKHVSAQNANFAPAGTRLSVQRALPKGGGGKNKNPSPTVPAPTCDHDVLVVGLGWAGLGAMYEIKQFNEAFGTNIKVYGVDVEDFYGGRSIAAELISGGEWHPFMDLIHDYDLYSQSPNSDDYLLMTSQKFFDIYYHDAENGEVDSNMVNEAKNAWITAFECLQKCANENYANTLRREFSMKDMLDGTATFCDPVCDWDPIGSDLDDRLKRIFQWYELQYEFLTSIEDTSPYGNVPLWTYYLMQDTDFFITTPDDSSCGANSADIACRLVEAYIDPDPLRSVTKLGTTVTKIDWTGGPCVNTTLSPSEIITANKVIFTGSAGVLAEAAGSLFDPSLPVKEQAVRNTFYIETPPNETDESMGLYRRLTVQLSEDAHVAANVPFTEYLFVAREDGVEYKCSVWQNLGHGSKGFFEGSRAFECALVNEYFENYGRLDVDDADVKGLIKDTLNKVLGLIPSTIDGCVRNETLFLRDPENFPSSEHCRYRIRDGPGKENWKGAWSTFRTGWKDEDYDCARNALPFSSGCNPVDDPVLYFAGEAFCPVYVGFMHGAWESGRVVGREIIEHLTDGTAPDDWEGDVLPPPNCEIPDGTPPIKKSKTVP